MAKKGKKLHIILQAEELGKQEYQQKSVIIGSGPTANLLLEHDSVSAMHAILQPGDDDRVALVVDLGSDEGIAINGRELEREGEIRQGDTLTIGEVDVLVIAVGDDEVGAEMESAAVESQVESTGDNQSESEAVMEVEPEPIEEVQTQPILADASQETIALGDQDLVEAQVEELDAEDQVNTDPAIETDSKTRKSGQHFFYREHTPTGLSVERVLEVKVMWGPVAIDVREFGSEEAVTVGEQPQAAFQIGLDWMSEDNLTLATPNGKDGFVLNISSGMDLEVRRDNQDVDVGGLPSVGAVRTYALKPEEKARVTIGQLAFLFQYVSKSYGVQSSQLLTRDFEMGKWWWTFFVLFLGLLLTIEITPTPERDSMDYLRNPARFAQLIMPTQEKKKKTFEEIKKKQEEEKKSDLGKWKKAQTKSKTKKPADVPREVKREQDRKVATNAGILGLLKKKGGGTGDNASSVFGGAAMTSLDASLDSLSKSGMGDTSGFGGMGTRGGAGGGSGLGLGGLGTAGYGRGGGLGTGNVKLGHRGKARVKIRKGRTRIVGGLSQEVVGRYIKRYWAQFKYCYERELTKNPNLYGKVTTNFTIAGNGRVGDAQVFQSTMNNTNVEQCLLRVIRRIRFPSPKGGGEVIVTYPFMFTTAGN